MRTLAALAALAVLPTPPQDDRQAVLDKLLPELEATAARYWNVPRDDGRFLGMLVRMNRSTRALEVGTANGYSGIWLGLALEETGGKLTTIEIDPAKAREAKANFAKVGLADRIAVLEGDAHKIVRTLDGPFDFIFLDADMGRDLDYLEALLHKLAPGGVLLRHNAIKYASTMKDYLEAVKKHPDLDTLVVSCTMEDGFAVSRKKGALGK
jgi:predicted O-methyltransferase YrrM